MNNLLSRLQFRERNFFLLVLPLAIAFEWAFYVNNNWQQGDPRVEWVALIDLCLFMPLVYFAFFSKGRALKPRLLRMLGIAGLGLWTARFLVPDMNQFVIHDLTYLRNFLIAFVIAFEIWFLSKVIKAVYKNNADTKTLERDFAMPEWIAKLMLLEARFWKAVWAFFKRK